jgi:hypothetical protein
MKITKRQLKRIIKEERQKLLKEYGAASMEVMSPLVQFAQAYSGLGDAIQSQIIELSNAHGTARFEDVVYELSPEALDRAFQRLQRPLTALAREGSDDAADMMDAMEAAAEIFAQESPGPNW